MKLKLIRILIGVFAAAGITDARLHAGQKFSVGRSVPVERQLSMDQIDHRIWDELVKRHVNELGQVDYESWQNSRADSQALDRYFATLSKASQTESATQASQLAFWINAYNAVTVKGILREYPTSSIRNHTAKFVGYNIWHDLLLNVGGTQMSLDSIEHKVLRKVGEPRIHFAIVCASTSCPRLLNQAYSSTKLEQQLTLNTKDFFSNPANFRYDGQRFHLSAILDWFGEDFGPNQAARLRAIAPYLPTQEAQKAAADNTVSISFQPYDWSLNEQKTTPVAN